MVAAVAAVQLLAKSQTFPGVVGAKRVGRDRRDGRPAGGAAARAVEAKGGAGRQRVCREVFADRPARARAGRVERLERRCGAAAAVRQRARGSAGRQRGTRGASPLVVTGADERPVEVRRALERQRAGRDRHASRHRAGCRPGRRRAGRCRGAPVTRAAKTASRTTARTTADRPAEVIVVSRRRGVSAVASIITPRSSAGDRSATLTLSGDLHCESAVKTENRGRAHRSQPSGKPCRAVRYRGRSRRDLGATHRSGPRRRVVAMGRPGAAQRQGPRPRRGTRRPGSRRTRAFTARLRVRVGVGFVHGGDVASNRRGNSIRTVAWLP